MILILVFIPLLIVKPFSRRAYSVPLSAVLPVTVACILSACGQRGPLYLPTYPAPVVAPAQAPADLPQVVTPTGDVSTQTAEPAAPAAPASPSR